MKRICLTLVILSFSCLALFGEAWEKPENNRTFDNSTIQNSCSMELALSNFGMFGQGHNTGLIYPTYSGINYLYVGSLWIGGKKYRRNSSGELLYWVAQVPTADSSAVIVEGEPGWSSSMHPVVDTLTCQGFDGDRDLYEMLPAYNPLLSGNTSVVDLYDQYNIQDKVMKSLLSYPSPLPFSYPDPLGIYCFTIPQDVTGNEPAFETCSTYYYDFCPFGTIGERDWGSSRSSNNHVPLGLAIEQKSYAWPLQNHDKMVIFKCTLHNSSVIDTLFDICIGSYVDSDIGPSTYGASVGWDDKSGYVMGTGYEFAYSRDDDFDNGASPGFMGCKLYLPNSNLNNACYNWSVGNGPDDFHPQSLSLGANATANEKYWLMTGRNPVPGSATRYQKLRGGPNGDQAEYIQSSPGDTRFLVSQYGDLPTASNPNPANRLNIAPGEALTLYMVIFMDNSLEGLKTQSQMIENFIDSNFTISSTTGLASIPYMTSLQQVTGSTVQLNWFSYTNPDHFEMMYKPVDAPASQWQSIVVAGNLRTGQIEGLTDLQRYKFKVASIFNPGPNEVYLESQTLEMTIDNHHANDDDYITPVSVMNYPNPFNAQTGTTFRFNAPKNENFQLIIYNTKGQRIRTFTQPYIQDAIGYLSWYGQDDNDKSVSSGVYYYVLKTAEATTTGKVLFIK